MASSPRIRPHSSRRSWFTGLVGRVHWRPPTWLRRLLPAAQRIPAQSVSSPARQGPRLGPVATVLAILVVLALWSAAPHLFHRRDLVSVPFDVAAKAPLAPITVRAVPPDLTRTANHIATFDLVFNRPVASLPTMAMAFTNLAFDPPLPGRWTWHAPDRLRFRPDRGWPLGTTFTLRGELPLDPPVPLSRTSFATLRLTADTPEFRFVSAGDSQSHEYFLSGRVDFSLPIDRQTARTAISLRWLGPPAPFAEPHPHDPLRFTFDSNDRTVHFKSAPLLLPTNTAYAQLVIEPTLRTRDTAATLQSRVVAEARIPAVADMFRIDSLETSIVRKADGTPHQLLIVTTVLPVSSSNFASQIEAILPEAAEAPFQPNRRAPTLMDDARALLARSRPLALQPIPDLKPVSTVHSFAFDAPEQRWVAVRTDHNPNTPLWVATPSFPREIAFEHPGSLLPLGADKRLPIQCRGVERIHIEIARVRDSHIPHLISQTAGHFSRPIFRNWNFTAADVAQLGETVVSLTPRHPAELNPVSFDLGAWMDRSPNPTNAATSGIFLLTLTDATTNAPAAAPLDGTDSWYEHEDYDYGYEQPRGSIERRLVLVTDLALIAKHHPTGCDVFVLSLGARAPTPNIEVSILGRNGLPLATARTDALGRAQFPLLSGARDREPVAIVARHDRDVAFLPFERADRELNLSRFDIGGIRSEALADLRAFAFTDRGLFRPGDQARFGIVLVPGNWDAARPLPPIRLSVIDPRGETAESRLIADPGDGLLDWTFTPAEAAPTGPYKLVVALPGARPADDTVVATAPFRVDDFQADRMKLRVAWDLSDLNATNGLGWTRADQLPAVSAQVDHFYGKPAANRRIAGRLFLQPAATTFPAWPGFLFGAQPENQGHVAHETPIAEHTTGDDGHAHLALNLGSVAPRGLHKLTALVEAYEGDSGQCVRQPIETLVSASDVLVGVHAPSDLSYLPHHADVRASWIALNASLASVTLSNLTFQIARRDTVWIVERSGNGSYQYRPHTRESVVLSRPIPRLESAFDTPLATTVPGAFVARLLDSDLQTLAEIAYFVGGEANLAGTLDRDAQVDIRWAPAQPAPGQELELTITAPYPGSGLLTLERESVHAAQWFFTTNHSSVQRIRIPASLEGNVFAHVTWIRSPDSASALQSPLSYGVATIPLDRTSRTARLELQTPALTQPGQAIAVQFRADRPGRALLYAVDEGILQVAGYATPQPLDGLMPQQALEVRTAQLLDLLFPEPILSALSAPGGDGDDELIAAGLNPFKRKKEIPAAFWSGPLPVGTNFSTWQVDVPHDFNGTLRVIAVMAAGGAAAAAESVTISRAPLILTPTVPTFAAPGDEFEINLALANNLEGANEDIVVALDLEHDPALTVLAQPAPSLRVARNLDRNARWRLKAGDQLGNATLTFRAEAAGRSALAVAHLSIRPATPLRSTLISGIQSSGELHVAPHRDLFDARATVTLCAGGPAAFLPGLTDYLDSYEHCCTEQLVSRALPALVLGTSRLSNPPAQAEYVERHTREIVRILAQRQAHDGSFGLWWAGGAGTPFHYPTLHAMQLLIEARDRGGPVPSGMLMAGTRSLQRTADAHPASHNEACDQAFAIYLLTRAGTVTSRSVESCRQYLDLHHPDVWKRSIAGPLLASALALMKADRPAAELIAAYQLGQPTRRSFESSFHSRLADDMLFIHLLARHFPQRLTQLDSEHLREAFGPLINNHYSTLSLSYSALAIDSYSRAVDALNQAWPIVVTDRTGRRHRHTLTPGVPFPLGPGTRSVSLDPDAAPSSGFLRCYQLAETGFDRALPGAPMFAGLSATRALLDPVTRDPVSRIRVGDDVLIELTVTSTDSHYHKNIAISDLLPCGFEVLPESLRSGPSHVSNLDFVDVREDRVRFYGSVAPTTPTWSYRAKATAAGSFCLPPLQAESMYNTQLTGRSAAGRIVVESL